MQGVRWSLFAEKAVVMLADAERAAAVTVEPGMDAKYLREAIKAKQSGEAEAARLRSILFPED